jgi:uncharacterized membrane protein YdjX (TVP38/TMEM64 family)
LKQLRIIIIVFILLAVAAFAWYTAGSDPETLLLNRLQLADQRLVLSVLLLAAFTLLSTLTGLPVFYLGVAMGFLMHFTPALLICWGANLAAVMGTFYLVRYAFTDYFQSKFGKKKLIRRINKRITRYGMWTVAFSRTVYIIPTNLINFTVPLSKISTRSYFLGTLLGLLPECLINVLSGYLIKHGVILLSSPDARLWHVLIIGASILLLAGIFIFLRIRQRRRKKYRLLKPVPYRE